MGLWQETVMKHGTEEEEEAVHEAKRAELLCRLATTPFGWPQRYPLGETQAVHRFTEADSEHTPHLLRYSADHVLKGVDEKAMMGGYAVFLLMNKLQDCILHNLIWDEKERTCYIIAYEDGTILKNAVDPEEKWTDAQREYWGLAEECRAE